jgi:hypothetical protein
MLYKKISILLEFQLHSEKNVPCDVEQFSFAVLKKHFGSRCAGRSGKTNGIVIKAKMRAGRRRKLFHQETGWREPNYAGVSVI